MVMMMLNQQQLLGWMIEPEKMAGVGTVLVQMRSKLELVDRNRNPKKRMALVASGSAHSRTKQMMVAGQSVDTGSWEELRPVKRVLAGMREDIAVRSQLYHQPVDGSVPRLLCFQVL